jgi:cell division protein FtsB
MNPAEMTIPELMAAHIRALDQVSAIVRFQLATAKGKQAEHLAALSAKVEALANAVDQLDDPTKPF